MKILSLISLISLLLFSCSKTIKNDKILFITTNVDTFNAKPNGTYLIELAVPFEFFVSNGFDIDIISPKGQKIPLYHSGDTLPKVKSIIKNDIFKQKTTNSLTPDQIDPRQYSAVIIPGGYGQFWDVHKNEKILRIISQVYEAGGVIGTLGHGTATLIDVKLESGQYLVEGKTMTCFPTWNEKNIMKQSDFGKLLPYDMEVALIKKGANLKIYNRDKKTNYEIIDPNHRLVTASFSSGGEFVAKEVIKILMKKEE